MQYSNKSFFGFDLPDLGINQIQQVPIAIHQAMAFPRACRPCLCGSVGIGSIVLLLKPMPASELVLVFNDDLHRINPTATIQDPPVPLLSSNRKKQQPQQRVPETWTPRVLKQPLSSGAGRHQQWEWSNAQ